MEYKKRKWIKIRTEFNHVDPLIISDELEKALQLIKNGKSPGEDKINSELYKYGPEEFKLRFIQILNNICTKNCIKINGEMLLYSQYFRKVAEETWKITEELVFVTPAIRYTLKPLTRNCRRAQNSLWQKHKMVFERDVHAEI